MMYLIIVYYATRFINGTLDTNFIRRSVVERVFNKRVSKEVYKRVVYYARSTVCTTKMNNTNITRNFFIQR
jgi:hypothetical protein